MRFEDKTTRPMHFGSMDSKPYVKLAKGYILGTAFIGYRVQRGLYTILVKTSYALIRLAIAKHAFAILYTILGKISYI